MNYVENIGAKAGFMSFGFKKLKPAYAEHVRDYGYDMYHAIEYGRAYVKSTDYVVRTGFFKKKAR